MNPIRDDHDDEPTWLRVARRELGQKEVRGMTANARILEYFTATRLVPAQGDETPWYSAFACWCMEQAGVNSPARANARSWLSWGLPLKEPVMGAVVVLSRGSDPIQGHVAFWLGQSRERVLLLGGNQGNSVSVAAYPKLRVLGYRWPATGLAGPPHAAE
jgi:uncharacterized protein (TIGR02594 family)